MTDSIKDKLRKIRALTASPNEAESTSARAMLNDMLKKYNISETEITDEATKERFFKFSNKEEDRLLNQIIFMVINNKREYKLYSLRSSLTGRKSRALSVELTELEFIQVKELFPIYRKELKKAYKDVYQAFTIANNIYPENKSQSSKEPTKEEIDSYYRALKMSQGIEKTEILKKIGGA